MKMRQFYSSVIFFLIAISLLSHRVQSQNTSYRLSDAVKPMHYDLYIQVDVDFYSFSGNVTIDIHVSRATSTIEMHSVNMTIANSKVLVSSGSDGETFQSVYMLYNNESEIMTIGLDRTLAGNSNHTITLSFSGRIEYDMKGLYMSTYYAGNIK
jgi:hypothetical protein